MTRERMIGLDRPVRLEWLDAAAAKLASGASEREAREHLWKLLEGVVAGDTAQSARGKTMTVISRVWITVPPANRDLRSRALARIEEASASERVAIHWAMMSAAYPFFLDLATVIGKLLQLHGSIAMAQVMRRTTETWGDRSTLRPAVQRILRMLVLWGTLAGTETRGEFHERQKLRLSSEFQELLLEALLLRTGRSLNIQDLGSFPATFPFQATLTAHDLKKATQFDVHREGSAEVVLLRRAG